jgi:polygalacturonase
MEMIWKLSAIGLLVVGTVACAQDTRVVTEPKIPPVCVKLEAWLVSTTDGRLVGYGEGKLDTERIQKAIDACGAGKAVELTDHVGPLLGKAGNIYLTGPLDLREGVTLLDRTTRRTTTSPREMNRAFAEPRCPARRISRSSA